MSLFPRKSVGYTFIHNDCNSFFLIIIKKNKKIKTKNLRVQRGKKYRIFFFEKKKKGQNWQMSFSGGKKSSILPPFPN